MRTSNPVKILSSRYEKDVGYVMGVRDDRVFITLTDREQEWFLSNYIVDDDICDITQLFKKAEDGEVYMDSNGEYWIYSKRDGLLHSKTNENMDEMYCLSFIVELKFVPAISPKIYFSCIPVGQIVKVEDSNNNVRHIAKVIDSNSDFVYEDVKTGERIIFK